ncbi:hypothetical protein CMQ_7010 [Grosmannia clavigera kw1407]|uniref:F-box domain containing protein n=1 Tax=Grosmannia clavigera (strain kw1407 / UAMH 11150) TaxID=655863 RepID=F0X700_GROCL|nr:uncharacterized protein CMQ_7010 [Grosmannia clavigera kw1407]EFX06689.1 hypothetical protein CMQ_7010 [Grosmannia clavigera kw1407]
MDESTESSWPEQPLRASAAPPSLPRPQSTVPVRSGLAMPTDTKDRKSFLTGLVAGLSLNEIWMLQAQLARLDLRTDVFGRLPPELQILVADQLGPADLGCCLDVSPAWRQAFLHESVRRGQARRCFPGLLEYASAVEQADASAEQVDRAFADTARKYAARARGRFRAALRHVPQPKAAVLADMDDATFDGPEYAYGRLFWQLYHDSTTHIRVDDLRSGRRQHFAVKDDIVRGERFMQSSFGDELVAIAFSGTRLLAWNFRTGEQHSKQMPAQIDVTATVGRRVCVLSQGNIYEWEVGGKMREVDLTGLDGRHRLPDLDGRLPSFFLLDPVRPDVFFRGNFVVEMAENGGGGGPAMATGTAGTGTLCFYVHEFRGRRFAQTFAYRLPFVGYAFPSSLIDTTVRRDTRGSFSLASWRVSGSLSGSEAEGAQPAWTAASVRGVGSLSFNVYTRTFALSFFRLPPLAPSLGRDRPTALRVHLWDDQLLTLIDRHREAHGGGKMRKADPMLFAFDDAYSEAAACSPPPPFSAVPVYAAEDHTGHSGQPRLESRRLTHFEPEPSRSGSWCVDDADWAKNGCLLRYILDLDTQPVTPDKPAHIGDYHIMGDDDFVVAVHHGEHTVWIFCADAPGERKTGDHDDSNDDNSHSVRPGD